MNSKRATGSAAKSVQKWVIDSDVKKQLRSRALLDRLRDQGLLHGSIELYLKETDLTEIGWGKQQPFSL